jgi:hypothetical protein
MKSQAYCIRGHLFLRRWAKASLHHLRFLIISQQVSIGSAFATIPSTRSVHSCTYPTWLCPRCFAFLCCIPQLPKGQLVTVLESRLLHLFISPYLLFSHFTYPLLLLSVFPL